MNQDSPQGQVPSGHPAPDYDGDGHDGLGAAFGGNDDSWRSPHMAPPPPPPPPPPVEPITGQRAAPRRDPLVLPSAEPATKSRRWHRSRIAQSPMLGFLSGSLTALALVAAIVYVVVSVGQKQFVARGPLAEDKVVQIPKRSSVEGIADALYAGGVIESPALFVWGTSLLRNEDKGKLKAGEYEFKAGVSMNGIIDQLVKGKVLTYQVTFPEGWTSDQIVARLNENPVLIGKVAAVPDEGTLSPDTYNFERGDSRSQIIDLMRKTQEAALKSAWEKRKPGLPLATPRDMLILASIVEKETGKAEERPRVAAVFVNRLKRGMRLESDPTILYGLYKGAAWSEQRGGITKAELASPNPYSTYKIPGLPPGPIANPGRAALEAVANPAQTNDLFFVADGTGGHVFAETLDEHNKNVARLRAIEAQRNQPQAGTPSSIVDVPAPPAPARPAVTRPAAPAAPAAPRPAAPRPAAPATP